MPLLRPRRGGAVDVAVVRQMTSRLTLPRGYERDVGPRRWRAEHQTIALPREEAPLIGADVVGMGGTRDVMRHGSRLLIHGICAKVAEVRIECVLEFLRASTEGIF